MRSRLFPLALAMTVAFAACSTEETPSLSEGASEVPSTPPTVASPDTLGSADEASADTTAAEGGELGRLLASYDFEDTPPGDFPSRLDYIAGNLEVAEVDGGRALRVGTGTSEGGPGGNGCFTVSLPEALPQHFTLEFRAYTTDPLGRAKIQVFSDGSDDSPDTRCNYPPPNHLFATNQTQGLAWRGAKSEANGGFAPNEWADVALTCDGPRCKMYVGGTRVANVPTYEFPRAEKLHVFLNVYRYKLLLDDLRIVQGGERSLYDSIETLGEISTTAITFQTNSAVILPASDVALGAIVRMMADYPDLRVEIEGHTDGDGTDADNQDLSERRAASVRTYLIERGIDGSRMTTSGKGESEPVASNDTPAGKAQNRRVVLRPL